MKLHGFILTLIILLGIGLIVGDRVYMSKLDDQFIELEKKRIVTTNKLTTAKIVQENLNHVHELVTENMVFGNEDGKVKPETKFFQFITTCINDLKLELRAVKPTIPETNGRIKKYGYEIEVKGDFFKFGELCAKFEDSRRIISVDKFDVSLESEKATEENGFKSIIVRMRVNTYLVRKDIPVNNGQM